MRGHEDYAAASPESFQVVLQSILRYELGNVCLVQFRKVTEFHKQAAQIAKTASQDLHPLLIRKVWKSHLKVAQTCCALPAGEVKAKPGDPACGVGRCSAGHCAECLQKNAREKVFDLFFNAAAHPWYFHILCETWIQ
jgi:hypothetical protein